MLMVQFFPRSLNGNASEWLNTSYLIDPYIHFMKLLSSLWMNKNTTTNTPLR